MQKFFITAIMSLEKNISNFYNPHEAGNKQPKFCVFVIKKKTETMINGFHVNRNLMD